MGCCSDVLKDSVQEFDPLSNGIPIGLKQKVNVEKQSFKQSLAFRQLSS